MTLTLTLIPPNFMTELPPSSSLLFLSSLRLTMGSRPRAFSAVKATAAEANRVADRKSAPDRCDREMD